jgi:uncharacterized protein
MQFFPSPDSQHIAVRLETDDLLLESLREVCQQEGIHSGAIVAGFGAAKFAHFHVALTDTYPPLAKFIKWAAPLEICHLSGVIAEYEPHVHITVSNEERALGGHLEEGTVVLYLCEIVIRRLDDMSLVRRPDACGLNMLQTGA